MIQLLRPPLPNTKTVRNVQGRLATWGNSTPLSWPLLLRVQENHCKKSLKQVDECMPVVKQLERTTFPIRRLEIIDAHGVKHSVGDMFWGNGVVEGEFGALVAGAIYLATTNAAAGEQHRHARGPV